MTKVFLCLMLVVAALSTGCTTRAWYEGVKQSAILHCEDIRDINERNRCIQQQPDYQDYQQQRQQLNKKE